MFARIVEFIYSKTREKRGVRKEGSILKTQKGFLEILPFFPENKAEKVITITLWMEKWDVEKYERGVSGVSEGGRDSEAISRNPSSTTTLRQHCASGS
jgi:hypothetical protein